MQHTLRKLAGLAFGGVVRPWPTTLPLHKPISRIPSATSSFQNQFQTISTSASSQNISSQSSQHAQPQSKIKASEQGRAAASTIRQLIQAGNIADAYLIVNSIRYAASPKAPKARFTVPGVNSMEQFRSVALAFTPDVSPRLPSHSLLHGLVRLGMTEKAMSLAAQMVSSGIRVRCKSIEAIYSELAAASQAEPNSSQLDNITLMEAALKSPDILTLDPSKALDRKTEGAIRLLGLVRKARERRSHNMFKFLVTLCLINGEIILASLLFGVLVRDWQARQRQAGVFQATPEPTQNHVTELCLLVDKYLSSRQQTMTEQVQFQAGVQTLAILANLLDRHVIQFQDIASLIHSLRHCPHTPADVWITGDDGKPTQVKAFKYFQHVLRRLIHSAWGNTFQKPEPPPNIRPIRKDDAIVLDIPSCNALLEYALHDRNSIPLAAKVLRYMMDMRYKPSPYTNSILEQTGEPFDLTPLGASKVDATIQDLEQARDEGNNIVLDYLIHRLIRKAQFDTLVEALPVLLPGFDKATAQTIMEDQFKGIRQSASFGPVVFSALLFGLYKGKRYTLAQKLWLWIRAAEPHSWKPDARGVVTPWCIPIQLYTTMLQIYAEFIDKEDPFKYPLSPTRGCRVPSHRKAMRMYRSIKRTAASIGNRLVALEESGVKINMLKRFMDIPRPDAGFFNAILYALSRRQKTANSIRVLHQYDRQFELALEDYLEHGVMPTPPEPELLEVAKDMVAEGFPIPLLYRKSLVGSMEISKFQKPDDDSFPGVAFIPLVRAKEAGRRKLAHQRHHVAIMTLNHLDHQSPTS